MMSLNACMEPFQSLDRPFGMLGRSIVSYSSPSKRRATKVHFPSLPNRGADINEPPRPFGKRYILCSLPPCMPRHALQYPMSIRYLSNSRSTLGMMR